MKVKELMNKLYNEEIPTGRKYYVEGDFFYDLVVIDNELYIINTYAKELQLLSAKDVQRLIEKDYNLYHLDYKKREDTPKEDNKYIEHIKMQENELHNHLNIIDKINEIIDKINGE